MNRKERALVAADESAGFVVGEKAKNLARVAARNQRNRPKRPRSKCEPSSQCDLYLVEYSPTYQSGNLQPASFSHQLGNIFPPHQSGNQLYFFPIITCCPLGLALTHRWQMLQSQKQQGRECMREEETVSTSVKLIQFSCYPQNCIDYMKINYLH